MPTFTRQDLAPPIQRCAQAGTWFSYARNHYARQFGGRTNIVPIQTEFYSNWDRTILPAIEIESSSLDQLRASFEQLGFNRLVSQRRSYNTTYYITILAAFNLYAACRKALRVPRNWPISFITFTSDDHPQANRWEPKFHDRCMFKMRMMTYERLCCHIAQDDWRAFIEMIMNLYDTATCTRAQQRHFSDPEYLREQQPRPTSVPSYISVFNAFNDPVPPFVPPRRETERELPPTNNLATEYQRRQENVETVGACKQSLKNMIDRAPIDQAIADLIYDLLLSTTIPAIAR